MTMKHKAHPQILIVEDDPALRSLMDLVLSKEDHWIAEVAKDGEVAIEK